MNLFDGRLVRGSGGGPALRAGGRELPLPTETFGPLVAYNDGDVTAGVRPEHLTVGEKVANGNWVMDVLLLEPLGSTTLATLGRDGWQLLAQVGGRPALRERQTVEVGLDVRHLHLFERSSGAALPRGVGFG
jgi:multiple sugar transport system ATP-binding protein